MTSEELKESLRKRGIPYWQVAKYLGVSESTLARWMRDPTKDQALEISAAADEIVNEKFQRMISEGPMNQKVINK